MTTTKTPQGLEKWLGWMILLLLMGIAAGVFKAQYELNPAVAIKAAPPVAPVGSTNQGSALGKSQKLPPAGPLEIFTTDTLADKINGKADLYLTNGFVRLECRRFRLADAGQEWFEVFVYDMGEARRAFAVYSLQQRSGGREPALAPHAYQTENALYLVHGQYYLEIIASFSSTTALDRMKAFAADWIQNTPVSGPELQEAELFPAARRVENSLKLIGTDAFGYEGFRDIFTAEYRMGAANLTAFLSLRPTGPEAEKLSDEYRKFLLAFGGQALNPATDIPGLKAVNILDTYEIVFSRGRILAGVHGAEDLQQALELSKNLYEHLGRHEK